MRGKSCKKCKQVNDIKNTYCNQCHERLRFRFPCFIFLLILLSYPLVANIRVPQVVERIEFVQQPKYIIREINETQTQNEKSCGYREFAYNAIGGRVRRSGVLLYPQLQLINLENRWGTFQVNFSYMNMTKFPYDIFGGDNLLPLLANGTIRIEDATYYSQEMQFVIGPGQSIIVKNSTGIPAGPEQYWAIADIVAPSFWDCTITTRTITNAVNKTFTDYVIIEAPNTVKVYQTLAQRFQINTWMWILFWLMCFIICVTSKKAYERKKVTK